MPMSFFTNSSNSYGSAIPFQRIVEPAQMGFFLRTAFSAATISFSSLSERRSWS